MNQLAPVAAATEANGQPTKATAYIAAPAGMDTSGVRHLLEGKGISCFSPDQLDLPAQNLVEIILEGMKQADIIVCLVDATPASNSVYFELGFASACRKPTVVLATSDVETAAWIASGVPCLRFDPANPSGVEFSLTQVLKVPHHGSKSPTATSKRTKPIGQRADELLAELRAAGDELQPLEFERIIAQAIRDSGVLTVAPSGGPDRGVDFAVWSDDLYPWVGNPFFIEVKTTITDSRAVNAGVGQLARAMVGSGNPWGMLIYHRTKVDVAALTRMPNILSMSAEQFLEALRDTGFGDLVRKMRNARVHGDS